MSTSARIVFPTRTRWGVIVMLLGFPLLGHFNRVAISVVGKQLIKEGTFTEVRMGVVYTAFLLVYTFCMIPGGWFIDRVGPAAALRWMALAFGACAMLTGGLGWLALPAGSLWGGLVLLRSVTGATSAPLHPGSARGVALWTTPSARSTANGLVGAAALLGVSITYPGFGWLMDHFGWPASIFMGGAAFFAFGMAWKFVAPPYESPAAKTVAESPVPERPELVKETALVQLLSDRSLLLVTASYTAVGYVQYLFFYWVDYYFENVLHRSTDESRWASFVVTMSMAVGMALGGGLSDAVCLRFGDRSGRRLIALIGMLLCALCAWLGVRSDDPARVTLLFSLSLGTIGMCEGVFWTAATELGGQFGGQAAAIMNTGGNSLSALAPTITPLLATHVGRLLGSERRGWEAAMGFACVICALGAAMWLGIEPPPRESPGVARSAPDTA